MKLWRPAAFLGSHLDVTASNQGRCGAGGAGREGWGSALTVALSEEEDRPREAVGTIESTQACNLHRNNTATPQGQRPEDARWRRARGIGGSPFDEVALIIILDKGGGRGATG